MLAPERSSSLSPHELLNRLEKVLTPRGPWSEVGSFCGLLHSKGMRACLFGGALRDLARYDAEFGGAPRKPRDFDIVVETEDSIRLERLFDGYVLRKTRFGGLRLLWEGSLFDVWPLRETWAFREEVVPGCRFADLPRTTFLNVEAVAAEIGGDCASEITIHEHGFFDAMDKRVVEINLKENAWPQQSLVRAVMTVEILSSGPGPKWTVGPELMGFFREWAPKGTWRDYYRLLCNLYGKDPTNRRIFKKWYDVLADQTCHANPVVTGGINLSGLVKNC